MNYDNNKRYYTLDSYFKHIFSKKVVKVALDIGATCPNLDGTISCDGCSYCTGGSGDFAYTGDVLDSFNKGIKLIKNKWQDCLYMPYFQSYSNTYMPVEKLKANIDKLINLEGVIGFSIATRPDCITDEMYVFLEELAKKTFLIVELGLQSSNDTTLKLINRGHDFKCFKDTFYKLKSLGIKVCVHIIDGLIGETKKDMLNTAKDIALLHPDFLKIHLLYFAEGTLDSIRLKNHEIKPLEKVEYLDILISQLELIPDDIVIERLTGDGDKTKLIAPKYSMDKKGMLSAIDNTFRQRNTFQGKLFK